MSPLLIKIYTYKTNTPRQTAKLYWKSSCLWKEMKEGHDLMQRKKLHCLLNLSTTIRYKNTSSYTKIHVVAIVSLFLG